MWLANAPGRWRGIESVSFAGPGNQRATDAAVLGDLLVVVGVDASRGDFDPAVWVSSDPASTWARVGTASPGFRQAGDQGMRDVVQAGQRLVAVGYERTASGYDAAVWTSADGTAWARSVTGGLGGPADQQMDSVVTFGGLVVAGGFASSDATGEDGAVWVSQDDGITWTREHATALGGVGDQHVNALAVGGPGLIAVGEESVDGDTDAAVWTSSNGVEWERVVDTEARFGGPGVQRMFTVAAGQQGLVAAGVDGSGSDADGVVWTSADGLGWERQGHSPATSALTDYGGQAVKVLVPIPDGVLALGAEGRGNDDDADAWIGRPLG